GRRCARQGQDCDRASAELQYSMQRNALEFDVFEALGLIWTLMLVSFFHGCGDEPDRCSSPSSPRTQRNPTSIEQIAAGRLLLRAQCVRGGGRGGGLDEPALEPGQVAHGEDLVALLLRDLEPAGFEHGKERPPR